MHVLRSLTFTAIIQNQVLSTKSMRNNVMVYVLVADDFSTLRPIEIGMLYSA
jgi:hypothetical protein